MPASHAQHVHCMAETRCENADTIRVAEEAIRERLKLCFCSRWRGSRPRRFSPCRATPRHVPAQPAKRQPQSCRRSACSRAATPSRRRLPPAVCRPVAAPARRAARCPSQSVNSARCPPIEDTGQRRRLIRSCAAVPPHAAFYMPSCRHGSPQRWQCSQQRAGRRYQEVRHYRREGQHGLPQQRH